MSDLNAYSVIAFFTLMMTLGFVTGGSTSGLDVLSIVGLFVLIPLTLMQTVANAVPLLAPAAFLVVPVSLLSFYRNTWGPESVLLFLGSAIAVMAS